MRLALAAIYITGGFVAGGVSMWLAGQVPIAALELAVLLGVAGTILGVLATVAVAQSGERLEASRRKSEENRWYADHYLGRKMDTLNSFLVSLVEYYQAIRINAIGLELTGERFGDRYGRNVQAKQMEANRWSHLSIAFLTTDENSTVQVAVHDMNEACWP